MTTIRKDVRFRTEDETPYSFAYLQKYIEKYPTLKLYEVIELIFEEHAKMKNELATQDDIANRISEQVINSLKGSIDITKVRTGYIDKTTRALMLLVNSFIMMNGLDDKLPIKDFDVTTKPVMEAEEKVIDTVQSSRTKKINNEGSSN